MAGELYVGIDVSKDSLEVALGCAGEVRRVANVDRAITALAAELQPLEPQLVVMEASGGYERLVAALLWEAGLPVVIANPAQVRDFAKGIGQYAKTDRQDARLIARWAEVKQPLLRQLPDAHSRELSEMLGRRRQLLEMLVAERQRLSQTVSQPIRKELSASIASLERRIKRIEEEIEQRIRKSDLWQRTRELLESVPGVAKQTSLMLVAELPELGRSDRRHLASLVGVAPYPRDSGKSHRPRLIHGGRAAVRSALYMAALSAARFNPVLAPFYQRLLNRGAAKKQALVAVIRRLLGILNAIVRDRTPWRSPCAPA